MKLKIKFVWQNTSYQRKRTCTYEYFSQRFRYKKMFFENNCIYVIGL